MTENKTTKLSLKEVIFKIEKYILSKYGITNVNWNETVSGFGTLYGIFHSEERSYVVVATESGLFAIYEQIETLKITEDGVVKQE